MELDRRTKNGRELADRLNKQTVLERMPKVYFVSDLGCDRYRVGRTDWPGDVFNLVPVKQFEAFKKVMDDLHMPLLDLTNDDDGEEWEKARTQPLS